MITMAQIRPFFPAFMQEEARFQKYMLKEYLQLMMLNFLSTHPVARKICFIGGTNLRLVKGIDRFSEDIDFDCKDLSATQFLEMTSDLERFLQLNGTGAIIRDKDNSRLKAFRRSFYFPGLLYSLGLSPFREERFMIKIECQDQEVLYEIQSINIRGCGFFFPFPVPPDPVLCSMKLSAMLSRHKGRDFYDAQFLLSQTKPDYAFLNAKHGIRNLDELKRAVEVLLSEVDLKIKVRDFGHLVFYSESCERILRTEAFFRDLQ